VANERTKEQARREQEAQKKAEDKAKEQADAQTEMDDEIARAQIEATMKGQAKQIALLELDHRKALADAQGTGIPEDRVNQLFGLKAAAIGAGVKRNEEVVGSFSGEAAGQLGPSTTAEKIAANGQAQVDVLTRVEQILRRIEQAGGLTVQ
jgi:hypothetical protein